MEGLTHPPGYLQGKLGFSLVGQSHTWLNHHQWRVAWLKVYYFCLYKIMCLLQDFPSGPVVKNAPANSRDTSSSSGPGRFPMRWDS